MGSSFHTWQPHWAGWPKEEIIPLKKAHGRAQIFNLNIAAGYQFTELCVNIPAEFRESASKCSADHPKTALWHNISASHAQNLAGMFLHNSVLTRPMYAD